VVMSLVKWITKGLGLLGFLSPDCMHTSPSSFFALQILICPLLIFPYNSSSAIVHVSTSCNTPGCIKHETPLPPSRLITLALCNASNMNRLEVNTSRICFSPHDVCSSSSSMDSFASWKMNGSGMEKEEREETPLQGEDESRRSSPP